MCKGCSAVKGKNVESLTIQSVVNALHGLGALIRHASDDIENEWSLKMLT